MINKKRGLIISYLFASFLVLTSCLKPFIPKEGDQVAFEGQIIQMAVDGTIFTCNINTTFKLDQEEQLSPDGNQDFEGGNYFLIHKGSVKDWGNDCKKIRYKNYVSKFSVLLDGSQVSDPRINK